jgi:hypothetical protein
VADPAETRDPLDAVIDYWRPSFKFMIGEIEATIPAHDERIRQQAQDELILRHRCGCEVCAHTSVLCPASASSLAMEQTSSGRIRQQAYAEAIEAACQSVDETHRRNTSWENVISRIKNGIRALTPPAIPQACEWPDVPELPRQTPNGQWLKSDGERERLTGERLREIAKCNCVVREVAWAMCRFNWDAIALKVEAFMRGDAITRELEGETRK